MKVILVGNCGVGKTALIARQVAQTFEGTTIATIASSSFVCHMTTPSGKPISLRLWDTAGQERYQSITIPHYREAKVALVCCDSTCSLADNRQAVVSWSEAVREHAHPDCKIVIVATKFDLLAEAADREECATNIATICREIDGDGRFVTSAVTGEGLAQLFGFVASFHPATLGEQDGETDRRIAATIFHGTNRPCC